MNLAGNGGAALIQGQFGESEGGGVVRFVAGRELSVGEWKRRPDCRCSPGDGNQERRGFGSVLFSGEEGWVKAVARASHGDVKEPPFFHFAAFVPGANVRREMALGQEPVLGPAGLARREALVGQSRQENDLSFEAYCYITPLRKPGSPSRSSESVYLTGLRGQSALDRSGMRWCAAALANAAVAVKSLEAFTLKHAT